MSQDDFPAPQTGFVVTHFLVVADQDRSREFYRSVFGAKVVLERDPVIMRLANSWLILNVGGGPTDDKPTVTLTTPPDPHQTSAPRYGQLLIEHHYVFHVCRMPFPDWPEPVARGLRHINPAIYVPMQGPSELGMSGTLEDWDRSADLQYIDVPALVIGATHDTMDPGHLRWMSQQLPHGRYLHCPHGSHLSQFDDPGHYFPGLIDFLDSV